MKNGPSVGARRRVTALLATMAAVLAFAASAGCPGRSAAGDDALVDLARERGKVVIADFALGLCQQCRNQAAILDRVRGAYGDRIVVRVVPVNTEQGLVARYGVETIPHLVFLDPAGAVRFRRTGVMSFDDIAAQLRRMGVAP